MTAQPQQHQHEGKLLTYVPATDRWPGNQELGPCEVDSGIAPGVTFCIVFLQMILRSTLSEGAA